MATSQLCPHCCKFTNYRESALGKMLCDGCGMSLEGATAMARGEPMEEKPRPKAAESEDDRLRRVGMAAVAAALDGRHAEIGPEGRRCLDVIVWTAKHSETRSVPAADDAVRTLESAGYDLRLVMSPEEVAQMRSDLGMPVMHSKVGPPPRGVQAMIVVIVVAGIAVGFAAGDRRDPFSFASCLATMLGLFVVFYALGAAYAAAGRGRL